MTRTLIAAVTAAALGLGSLGATPAQALSGQQQNTLGWLLGAAALGALAYEYDRQRDARTDNRANDRDKVPAWRQYPPQDGRHDRDRWTDHGRGKAHWRDDRRDDRHDNRWGNRDARPATVPRSCVMTVPGETGPRDLVLGSCAVQAGLRDRLPENCAFEIRTREGRREVYGSNCLEQRGIRIAGR